MHSDYTGQGVDQLNNVIHTIKTNPSCRRIIMSAWNPMGNVRHDNAQSLCERVFG